MPVLRKDRSLRTRHLRDLALLGLPFLGLLAVVFGIGFWVHSVPLFVTTVTLALALAGVGILRHRRRFLEISCPSCDTTLTRTAGKAGDAITFVCQGCDTEWDTGFREARD